jgi:glucosamine--fructose-6-phosphate aminotransferase (isomerizing)
MCGIVGYVGQRPVQELLLQGLKALEYRGYDSAGFRVTRRDRAVRAVGNLATPRRVDERAAERRRRSPRRTRPGTTGIAHTAGRPTAGSPSATRTL